MWSGRVPSEKTLVNVTEGLINSDGEHVKYLGYITFSTPFSNVCLL